MSHDHIPDTPTASLFVPIKIGDRTMRNRIMHLAINTGFAENHQVTDRLANYWRARATGGVGAIVSGLTPVHASSVYKHSVLKSTDDSDSRELERFAESVSPYGALSLIQLVHNGAQMPALRSGPIPLSPSGCPAPGIGAYSRALSRLEIGELIQAFGDAALRCERAGVDGVEIHGAHGFLIHQFLSPLTNHRTDSYGGTQRKRMQFAFEVLSEVRNRTGPEFVVGFRMVVDEFDPNGITPTAAQETAYSLAAEGLIDYVSTSAGNYETVENTISPYPIPEAPLADLAAVIRAVVKVPVVAANRITTPGAAARIVETGRADIVGLGRAMLADPDWANRTAPGAQGIIRPCIGVNTCFEGGGVSTDKGIECAVNPDLAATEDPTLAPFDSSSPTDDMHTVDHESRGSVLIRHGIRRHPERRPMILVVGSGPAGLAFALEASKWDTRVRIVDSAETAGGQVTRYSEQLTGGTFGTYTDYAVATLLERGVSFEYGTHVGPDGLTEVLDGDTAHVVLATGSVPRPPTSPALSLASVLSSWDVLSDPPSDARVVVVAEDPGPEPLMLVDFLARQRCSVDVVTRQETISPAAETLTRRALLRRVAGERPGVSWHRFTSVHGQEGKDVTLYDLQTQSTRLLEAVDAVLFVGGRIPNDGLSLAVPAHHKRHVTVIGDARLPGRLVDATSLGYQAARSICNSLRGGS